MLENHALRSISLNVVAALGGVGLVPGTPVVVAFSGGADSLALLAALISLPDAHRPDLEAIHVDHGLRETSAEEATRALALAAALGARARTVRVEVRGKGGVEAAARRARYEALATEAKGRPILTAHTLDDQAETLLLRLSRGTGLRGAAGIRIEARIGAAHLIRPMLAIRRAQVEEAVRALGLSPVEDPTNQTDAFARNRIRAQVLPVLEGLAPGSVEALARFASLAREDESFLSGEAARARSGRMAIEVAEFLSLPDAIGGRVLRDLVEAAGGPTPSHERIEAIRRLAEGRGGVLHLAGGVVVSVGSGNLAVARGPTGRAARRSPPREAPEEEASVDVGDPVVFGGRTFHLTEGPGGVEGIEGVEIDGDLLQVPATHAPPYRLRFVRKGERLPIPGVGRRKVSDLLGEAGVPSERRWGTVVVEARGGEPIWLVGVRPLCRKPGPGESFFLLRTSKR